MRFASVKGLHANAVSCCGGLICMNKILLLLICLSLALPCLAEVKQNVENENGYVIANFEKTPTAEGTQMIKNTKSWFCINIIINGKVKEDEKQTD